MSDHEHFNEQISQFIDDEMSVEESEFFVRRLQRNDAARHQYLRYQLIGAAVRGEYRYPGAAELGRRLEHALDADRAPMRPASRWTRIAGGAGIAAGVALVAVFGLRTVNLGPESSFAGSGAIAAATGLDLPSYVVPETSGDAQPLVRVPSQVTGIQYLIHHARYTSGVNRTIMRSSVIAGQESDPTEDSDEDAVD